MKKALLVGLAFGFAQAGMAYELVHDPIGWILYGIREAAQRQTESIEPLRPDDIADAVAYIVTRDRRVAVNEMLVRAAEQTW